MGPVASKSALERGLETGLHFVSRTCVAGAYNRQVDIDRTGRWVEMLMERRLPGKYANYAGKWSYTTRRYLTIRSIPEAIQRRIEISEACIELFRNACPLNSYKREIITQSLFAKRFRTGTCGPMSYLLIDFLWQRAKDFSISSLEIYRCGMQDHAFVVVNRIAGSNACDPRTWGPDCFCADPWASMQFAAIDWHSKNREGDLAGQFVFRLEPDDNPYPFLGGERKLEASSWLSYLADYFPLLGLSSLKDLEVAEQQFKPLCEMLKQWEAEHRSCFQPCLTSLSRVEFGIQLEN